jgi:2-oxoglutarate/2-oxoacid ferredoxin oxidoreductase subunit beta
VSSDRTDAVPAESTYLDETMPLPFCPGCGHTKIIGFLDQALVRVGRPANEIVVVTDIGCIGLADRHFVTNAFHGLHGRSITYATGIKLADPSLTVVVLMGDGATGIGGAHLLSAARRNIGITVIVANNFNYGMTGGQYSATTPTGALTSTTPKGNLEQPLDLCGTLLPSRPTFLARTSVFAEDPVDLIEAALRSDGFALVDVWDLCVAYFAGQNTLTRDTIGQLMTDLGMEPGVRFRGDRPEFAKAWRDLYHPDEAADEEGMCFLPPDGGLTRVAESTLDRRVSILIAGAAGQKIRSAATLLGAGAIMSGLYATQKDDYPITVRTGYSAAEVILSPEPVLYTGVETPDIILIISPEGLARVRRRLASLPTETRVYADQGLGEIETPAELIRLPLADTARSVHKLAIAAVGLGAVLGRERLYPPEAFVAASERLQKAKVAATNDEGLQAGLALV